MYKIRERYNNIEILKNFCQYCNKEKPLNFLSILNGKKICTICFRELKK